jgi:hypothetical protein
MRVAFDDVDVDAQAGAVHDDLVLECLVDQGFADGSGWEYVRRPKAGTPSVTSQNID